MTILRHFFTFTIYTILIINAVIMTMQYFLGLGNIVEKAYDVIDTVNLASIF